ncbi:acetolactate synthase, small subunit [Deferribacter desulfuricans SSM1]|uniref:Acetolactate synthase small subunit n=1 Tax=Deferribacter desulfuricans (strain DSM 14783 / JCM 11476 / NBRC 101012 / SSM1) TaxID=639282 RepID=D3P8T2_DEFDS|nr:acetolactate synthase, small subunit [Deferribacter desulfuricans SSM1]
MRHIISVLVENKFGVLSRVAGLFSGRGYNIESLSVNTTHDPRFSVMTIVTSGDERIIEQIIKQLRKLINVIKVRDVTPMDHIEREMMLVKVHATSKTRPDIFNIINTFRGKVVDITGDSLIVEITGTDDKNKAFIKVLEPYGIIEVIKTGFVAIARGSKATPDYSKTS